MREEEEGVRTEMRKERLGRMEEGLEMRHEG